MSEADGDPSMDKSLIDTSDKIDACSSSSSMSSVPKKCKQRVQFSESPNISNTIEDNPREKGLSSYSEDSGTESADIDQISPDKGQDSSLQISTREVSNNKEKQKNIKAGGSKVGFYQEEEYQEGTEAYEDLKLLQTTFNLSDILSSDEARSLSRKKNKEGKTELHFAAARGDVALVRALGRVGGHVNERDMEGWTPAMYAAMMGELEALRLLHEAGGDLSVRDINGRSLLHLAAASGNGQLVAWLLALGFDVDNRDFYQMTSLHLAAGAGNAQVVCVLIRNGADISAQDYRGRTALKISQIAGHPKIIDLLSHEFHK